MQRASSRALVVLGALAGLSAALAFGLSWFSTSEPAVTASDRPTRIVSLTPPITAALFAIGAADRVVGVSDYCDVEDLPRLGTGLTPNYERIAELDPTLIVTESTETTRKEELSRLAPTLLLPWLTLEETTASLRKLGTLTDRVTEAEALASRYETELAGEPPPDAPRVLFVLGYPSRKLEELWYIRPDSLHGRLLSAAGVRNAVERPPAGPPKLSLEALVALDPDMIVVLAEKSGPADDFRASMAEMTTLRAVRHRRIGILSAEGAFGTGPQILELLAPLKAELKRLEGAS